jgi:hypothetical protein
MGDTPELKLVAGLISSRLYWILRIPLVIWIISPFRAPCDPLRYRAES